MARRPKSIFACRNISEKQKNKCKLESIAHALHKTKMNKKKGHLYLGDRQRSQTNLIMSPTISILATVSDNTSGD